MHVHTTTPPSRRVPLSRTEMVEHCYRWGTRLYRAGSRIYALLPQSDEHPSTTSVGVSPEEGAAYVFDEYVWEGHPILEPYRSEDRPARLGFRYTKPWGSAYRVQAMALRAKNDRSPRSASAKRHRFSRWR